MEYQPGQKGYKPTGRVFYSSAQPQARPKTKQELALERVGQNYQQDSANIMGLLRGLPQYKSSLATPEFEQLKSQAFGTGPLDLYERQREAQGMQLQRGIEGQTAAQQGQLANAYSQLAMGGGLSSGARERIGLGGVQQGLLDRQRLRAQNMSDLSNLGISEAGTRMDMQRSITDQLTGERSRQQQFEMDRARQIAEAQAGLLKGRREQEAAIFSKK